MAHKDKDTKKWSAQWFERTAKNEIFNLADEQGISKRTLENAKKELGVLAKRIKNTWYWELDKINQ